ncbi:MAG TPA: helix-hairpin-helix domain-containing protein [Myxococcota bacterium]|nr:helix-hairpin-helix domain-containing protein [Myxococcota bacterium]
MTRGDARVLAFAAAALLARTLLDGDAAARGPAFRPPPERGAARLLYGAALDPNREPSEVLQLLPGIGPARAEAIIAARPICSLADLDRVPGIGRSTLRALAGSLAFRDLPRNCGAELRPETH